MLRKIATIIAIVSYASSVSAATVVVNEGNANVTSGGQTQSIPSGTTVGPGDKVSVGANSSATVYYNDFCYAVVTPQAPHTVSENVPCEGQAAAGIPTETLLIGGLLVAGGVGAAIALSGGGGGSDSP